MGGEDPHARHPGAGRLTGMAQADDVQAPLGQLVIDMSLARLQQRIRLRRIHFDAIDQQFDGVFDTDGHILYSNDMQSIIYLYAYRNQFTVTDKKLKIKAINK